MNIDNDFLIKLPHYVQKERTVKDYFDFAYAAYTNLVPEKVYSNLQCYSLVRLSNDVTGYFGISFLDLRISTDDILSPSFKPKIIIAHRGTNDMNDILSDSLIKKQEIPHQYDDALLLTELTSRCFKKKNYEIIHVGHSLGASLAQMMGFKFDHRSIGFETAGTTEILPKIDPHKKINHEQFVSFTLEGSYLSESLPQVGIVIKGKNRKKNRYVEKLGFQIEDNYFTIKGSLHDVISNINRYHKMEMMKSYFSSDGHFIKNPKKLIIK